MGSLASGRRQFWAGVLTGAAIATLLCVAIVSARKAPVESQLFLLENRHSSGVVETRSGLQYRVLSAGNGAGPTETDTALITYQGRLIDGTTFDQSQKPTAIAVSGVIPGFAEGLKLMPKGAEYRFWIPPELGYGERATGPIPGNSVLIFDVRLVDVRLPGGSK